jgi:uncharacterized protein (TIGR02246 family)
MTDILGFGRNDKDKESKMTKTMLTPEHSDEIQLHSLYQQLMDGWNKGSGEAFSAPFAQDSDLVGFDCTHLKGKEEIITFHQQLFNSYVKGSHLVGKVKKIRFLSSDIALIHAIGGTIMEGQTDIDPERNSIQTLVATRNGNEKWYLAAFQNTRAQYFGRQEQAQALTKELRSLM